MDGLQWKSVNPFKSHETTIERPFLNHHFTVDPLLSTCGPLERLLGQVESEIRFVEHLSAAAAVLKICVYTLYIYIITYIYMNSLLVLRHLTFFNCRRNLTQLAAAAGPRLDRCFGAPSCDEPWGHGGFHSHGGIPTWLIHLHEHIPYIYIYTYMDHIWFRTFSIGSRI